MGDPTLRLVATTAAPSMHRGTTDVIGMNEASRIMGISERTLERRLADKKAILPRPFTIGGPGTKRLFRRIDVEDYVRVKALLAQRSVR